MVADVVVLPTVTLLPLESWGVSVLVFVIAGPNTLALYLGACSVTNCMLLAGLVTTNTTYG